MEKKEESGIIDDCFLIWVKIMEDSVKKVPADDPKLQDSPDTIES